MHSQTYTSYTNTPCTHTTEVISVKVSKRRHITETSLSRSFWRSDHCLQLNTVSEEDEKKLRKEWDENWNESDRPSQVQCYRAADVWNGREKIWWKNYRMESGSWWNRLTGACLRRRENFQIRMALSLALFAVKSHSNSFLKTFVSNKLSETFRLHCFYISKIIIFCFNHCA